MHNLTKPCLFLDRDGVIIKNAPYSKDPKTVVLLPGIEHLINRAKQKHYLVIIVTNQSGIGRGYLTTHDYELITLRMLDLLGESGTKVDKIYHAAFYEKSLDPDFRQNSHWRKPEAGMIQQACIDFPIDLKQSIMIGDRATDILAAKKGGVAKKILLHSDDYPDEVGLVPKSIEFEPIKLLSELIF